MERGDQIPFDRPRFARDNAGENFRRQWCGHQPARAEAEHGFVQALQAWMAQLGVQRAAQVACWTMAVPQAAGAASRALRPAEQRTR